MAVVLVLSRERHVAAMSRWSIHFARSRAESLHIVSTKGVADTYVSEIVLTLLLAFIALSIILTQALLKG